MITILFTTEYHITYVSRSDRKRWPPLTMRSITQTISNLITPNSDFSSVPSPTMSRLVFVSPLTMGA